MGAGSWAAGAIPAGLDVYTRGTTPSPIGGALKYDPTNRVFVLNADGTPATVDQVDQAVVLALTIPLGSIASSPKTGFDRSRTRVMKRGAEARTVRDLVNTALAPLLTAKSIVIDAVNLNVSPGRLAFEVVYHKPRAQDATLLLKAQVNY